MASTQVYLPPLPQAAAGATVLRWLRRPGEPLAAHEPLLIVLTDCAELALPTPAAGVLEHLLAPEGSQVAAGAAIASIAPANPAQPAPRAAAQPRRSTSVARRIAAALGIDLAQLAGSGPAGMIVKADVLAAAHPQSAPPAPPPQPTWPVPQPARARAPDETQALTVMEADLSAVIELCTRRTAEFAQRGLVLNPFTCIATALVAALTRHPLANSRWSEAGIRMPRAIHLACVRPDGMQCVRNAQDYSLRGMARALARADAMPGQAATFTLIEAGAAWLAQPPGLTPMALTLGTLYRRPAPEPAADRMRLHPAQQLTFAYDLRVLDQRRADAFLREVVARLARFSATVAGV